MAMARCRVHFGAHQGNGMVNRIEEPVEVPEMRLDHIRVVPLPQHIAVSFPDSIAANVPGDAQVRQMDVFDAVAAEVCL